jgi:4'-phosphopantetheinyl transferase
MISPVGSSPPEQVVEVWRVKLDPGDRAERLRAHLSPDELERLARLERTDVGARWLVSRAALREILAARLEVAPRDVLLRLDEHGRPRLDPAHGDGLDFNLSHSAGLALIATALGARVGVDVEQARPGRDPLRVADRYFSAAEVAAVRAFPSHDRPDAFLRYWTAKEALAKGLGLGLQAPRGELELAVQPGGTLVPVRLAREWRLIELNDLPSGYRGTLAVDDDSIPIVVRDWVSG